MKKMILVTGVIALAALASMTSPSMAAVFGISSGGDSPQLSSFNCAAIMSEPGVSGERDMWVAGSDGLARLYYWQSWTTVPINSNNYTILAHDVNHAYDILAAGPAGIDRVYFDGSSWLTVNVNTTAYNDVITDKTTSYRAIGAHAGGLDLMTFDGDTNIWTTTNISTTPYNRLVLERGATDEFYAAREGGLDRYYYWNGTWNVQNVNSNTYSAIAESLTSSYELLASGPNGTDSIYFWNGQWYTTQISFNHYSKLIIDPRIRYDFYGLRNGGVDHIYSSGGWVTDVVTTRKYTAISHDPVAPQLYGGANFSSLHGIVSCADYGQSPADIMVKVDLMQAGTIVSTHYVPLDASGAFNVLEIPAGTYDVAIKAPCWLKTVVSGVALNGAADLGTVTLLAGDLDGDNEVTSTDLSILGLNLGMTGD